jgi:hypothetical protein
VPAVAVLLYPVPALTTPKYLFPFYLFLGLFLTWTIGRITATGRLHPSWLAGVMGVAVMLACFLPIHPTRQGGLVRLTSETWRPTDDGPRSFWGYGFALRELSRQTPSIHRWLDPLLAAPGDLVLVAPFDGWLATGAASQAVTFRVASYGSKAQMGPSWLWAPAPDKKVLLTEPGPLRENVQCHFASAPRPPREIAIPLAGFGPDEIVTLRLLVQGIGQEVELARKTDRSPDELRETLRVLVLKHMIEPSGPGVYRLKHALHEPQFYPDPTGGS